MKKRWVISVIIAVMVSMTGCGGTEKNDKNNTDKKQNVSKDTNKTDKKQDISKDTNKKENETKEESHHGENEGVGLRNVKYDSGQKGKYILRSTKTGLYGLVDSTGSTLLPMEYDEMNFGTINNRTEIAFKVEGKWGVCDEKGKEIIPAEYDDLKICDENYLVKKDGKQSILGEDGKIIKDLQGRYERIIGNQYLFYTGSYWDINENQLKQKITYVDGKYIVYDWGKHEEGEESYRILDKDGNVIYEIVNNVNGKTPIFSIEGLKVYNDYYMVTDVINDRYVVLADGIFGWDEPYKDGKYYLYDMVENKKIDIAYNRSMKKLNEDEVIAIKDEGLDIYNSKGKLSRTLDISGYDDIDIREDIIVAQYGDSYRVYDKKGKEITGERYLEYEPIGEYLILKNLDGEWGMINKKGDVIIGFGFMEENSYCGEIKYKEDINGKVYLVTNEEDGELIFWVLW